MNRILTLTLCLAPAAFSQTPKMSCDEGHWRERGHFCEIRETSIPSTGRLDVDGGVNGGISIHGANRNDVFVRAKVEATEDDASESRRIVSTVHVDTAGSRISASGPTEGRHGWSVSYEIFVPQSTGLVLHTHNGGISIASVKGNVQFEAENGGVSLVDLAGSVQGHTTNGGLHVELASDHWDGDRCDVSTTNGGVTVRVPANYSAHLETGTVNGGMKIDFPVTLSGEITHHLAVDIGAGGNLVRATTTNGGVHIERI